MKRIQIIIITLLIAIGLWFLLGRHRPPIEPGTAQKSEIAADEIAADEIGSDEIGAATPVENAAESAEQSISQIGEPNPSQTPSPKSQTTDPVAPPVKPLTEQEIVERRKFIRATLSGLYTAQAAYFAEFDRYSSDLGHIGYLPAEGTIKARFGFLEPFTPSGGLNTNEDPSRSNSDSFIALKDDSGDAIYQYDEYSKPASLAKYERYCDNRCTVTADQFELISAFNLDADETLDVWIIDSRKNIRHVVDDTKE
jgi:hypothetical protein